MLIPCPLSDSAVICYAPDLRPLQNTPPPHPHCVIKAFVTVEIFTITTFPQFGIIRHRDTNRSENIPFAIKGMCNYISLDLKGMNPSGCLHSDYGFMDCYCLCCVTILITLGITFLYIIYFVKQEGVP